MILKVVNFETREGKEGLWEVADYIDGIVNATITADDSIGMPTVRCTMSNSAQITISVPHVAYLMNDNGKTIEKIEAAGPETSEDGRIFPKFHDAVNEAITRSLE